MSIGKTVGTFAVEHVRLIAGIIIGVTLLAALLASLPSIWPRTFEPLYSLKIDTDPENMLPADEPVRVFHDRIKKIMSLYDMIVIGVVSKKNQQDGVFTPESLEKVYALTQFARGLRWRSPEDPARSEGVVASDMIAPSLMDNVESGGAGVVRFEWLMRQPPESREEALAVRRKALELPFLRGTLVSEDGKALALYLPITSKDISYRIYSAIERKIENPSQLFPSEIGNEDEVLRSLKAASQGKGSLLIRRLWQELSPKTQRLLLEAEKGIKRWQKTLSRYKATDDVPESLRDEARSLLRERREAFDAFVADANSWMGRPVNDRWLNPDEDMRMQLSAEGLQLLDLNSGLTAQQALRLKRLWLEAAFPATIIPSRVAAMQESLSYHITGLPVAEDTFGVQMFKQMAISAPVAMAIIFMLLWLFFRSALAILPAIYDALIASLVTMSLLIITGNTIHIMSSMIPIFIVPIAVLDDVHVISEFFDRYRKSRNRKQTIIDLMGDLFTPMLYTTLTTAVGFASLALAPIPPVQVFGLFVALGVIVAWLCSILLVPAFLSVVPEKTLQNFKGTHVAGQEDHLSILGRMLRAAGRGTSRYAGPIIALSTVSLVVSAYGISRIRVNDNPTKWFEAEHPIRVADRVLNSHFGGTYMAYLAFRPQDAPALPGVAEGPGSSASETNKTGGGTAEPELPAGMNAGSGNEPALPAGMNAGSGNEPALRADPVKHSKKKAGDESSTRQPDKDQKPQIFKDPVTLRWLGALQSYIDEELGSLVGKSNSVTDIVETVHRALMVGVERDGKALTAEEAMRVPDTRGGVAQSLLQFQNSHRPQDLWHFVTPDYRTAVIWLQLTSGDNRDMSAVVQRVDDWLNFWNADSKEISRLAGKHPERFQPVMRSVAAYVTEPGEQRKNILQFIAESPATGASLLKKQMAAFSPGDPLRHDWFGLTYINVVWQEKMVKGMLKALLGSFAVVFLMMTLLYRSALWGALCMAPLTVTIALSYGMIGLIGKDYDMPVAVLSALSLGLAVDYAIHFLTRSRAMYLEYGSWEKTAGPVFGEPARAISRNAIVVSIGFIPLLLAPLVPYQTVGGFIAAILLLAGLTTLLLLPAAVQVLESRLFPRTRRACRLCNRGTCIVVILLVAFLVVFNVEQFIEAGWTALTLIGAGVVIVLALWCGWMSKGEKAKTEAFASKAGER